LFRQHANKNVLDLWINIVGSKKEVSYGKEDRVFLRNAGPNQD